MNFLFRSTRCRTGFQAWFAPVGILLALWFSIETGSAAGIVPVPVETLATQAEWILRGSVESLETSRGTSGVISTRVELAVTEVWKGAPTPRVVVALAGGMLGDRQVVVKSQATFKIGEEVVVFLVRNDRGEGVILELAQGKFRVTQDASKQAWVSNGVLGSAGVGEGGESTRVNKVMMPHQRPLRLEELKRRVLEALKP